MIEGTAPDACFVHINLKVHWNEEDCVVEGSYAPNKREHAANVHNVCKKANNVILGLEVLKVMTLNKFLSQ